ncbi:unnamed protein product, partial [Bubo scandiacus]
MQVTSLVAPRSRGAAERTGSHAPRSRFSSYKNPIFAPASFVPRLPAADKQTPSDFFTAASWDSRPNQGPAAVPAEAGLACSPPRPSAPRPPAPPRAA